MLMNDMGDDSRARQQTRIWRNAATLAGFLSFMMAINVALTTVLPGVSIAMRVVSGVLAVVSAAGTWQAVRSYRSRSSKYLVLSFACSLGSLAVLLALRSMA
ncbi:hypothetical protein [Streptomyces sp. NRRL S-646]|uniref:hypothetical protein n=1 Tax=Streptomyces sp. NRRL S-646 TaxID=1463917 RepID=UPI0004C94EC6|nr:hypothetical protein [Streptomyces sp. NRRL S-646]